MALTFKSGWNTARQKYVNKYGQYQAFLDTLNESVIRQAFIKAKDNFTDRWVNEFIDIATNSKRSETVTIEQGSHQPEDMKGGGFCLHFTGRDNYGYAFHFYIVQNSSGYPVIFEITYRDGGQTISDSL